jgi:uncharacterized membrane protein YhfC
MNDIVFSGSTLIGYCITAFIYIALPVSAFFIMRKYNSAKLLPIIAGIVTYFLSTRIADGMAYLMLPAASFAQKAAISTEIVCITEEVGRWLAIKYPLFNVTTPGAAVCYGIGHAGLECWIRGFDTFGIIGYGQKLNREGIEAFTADKTPQAAEAVIKQLRTFADNDIFCSILDWLNIVTIFGFHICLSVMIFKKFNDNNFKSRWLLRAILLHYLLNVSVWLVSFSGIAVLSKLTGIIVGVGIIAYVYRTIDGRSVIDDILYPSPQT